MSSTKCARGLCDEAEFRINGYCSNYCEDVDALEQEIQRLRAALNELTDPPAYSEANFAAMVYKASQALS